MPEHTDFLLQPAIGNASELISCALGQHLDLIGEREDYVDYTANRPRVERVDEHGLFTNVGRSVALAKVQSEVARHKDTIWTHVVLLRREGAVRPGYGGTKQRIALLRPKRVTFCKHVRIDGKNLRWYTAFHNEGHHPHVYLMVHSAKDSDGCLTEKSIEAMCSGLAHDVSRQDFAYLYDKQN